MFYLTANLVGRSRREILNGREYIVAPMTLIVPGVLNGSRGALYYPPAEITRDPSAWNHIPIVVSHPSVNGQNVSARDPSILNRQGIGVVLHARADNGKLVADGWFDVEATRRVDYRVLSALEAGRPIELSTGLFTDNEPASGTYNGQVYTAIARNYRPDHLAILPDQVGACSLRDGCGVFNTGLAGNACPCGEVDRTDILPIPTINWAAIAAYREQPKPCHGHLDDDVLPLPTMRW